MNDDLIRQGFRLQQQLDGLINPEISLWRVISLYYFLPGLRGFWPMSANRGGPTTGDVTDLSGNARHLTYNGNPTYNVYNDVVPYIDLDGTGDYFSWADTGANDPFDILGTETYEANPGLTMIAWLRSQSTGVNQFVMGKSNDGSGPYFLFQEAADNALFRIRDSTDTTNYDVRITDFFTPSNVWSFFACRYIPSTEIKIWQNDQTNTNIVGIPAAILNGTDVLGLGGNGGGLSYWNGDMSLAAVCASALPDALISSLFQQSRGLFGV